MKVVLVVLSGDPQGARDNLAEYYPQATIETVLRSELETG